MSITVVTLNTRGTRLPGTKLSERYAAIAAGLDTAEADLVCLQEVTTYHHLRLLRRGLRSFADPIYRRSFIGPAGGLVILSRRPVDSIAYTRFAHPAPGLPWRTRLGTRLGGTLAVRLDGLRVLDTHPTANTDGDWSPGNRFEPLQRAQFAVLATLIEGDATIVCGDFNAPRHSTAYRELIGRTGLVDAFGGQCPPTFHSDYLGAGRTPHCIDFILAPPAAGIDRTTQLFAERIDLPSGPGHVSDHLGLTARITLPV